MFELHAPASWACVEFISDLHLHPDQDATFKVWQACMQTCRADALFILGDLFEVWIGDDAALGNEDGIHTEALAVDHSPHSSNFALRCLDILRDTARNRPVYFLHGNRDFLFGQRAARYAGLTILPDPTCLCFDDADSPSTPHRVLLSHGDEWCLADTDYQKFRAEVHSAAWREAFLTKPLRERTAIARQLRDHSEAKKRLSAPESYADLDTQTVKGQLALADANTLVHGHTHQPAQHALGGGQKRIVLSDWDAEARVPRQEVLRLHIDRKASLPEAVLSFERKPLAH